jgi:D-aminopeptidase
VSSSSLTLSFDENAIDAIFTAVDQCHLPGAAVGIAIAGRPVYRKGFGLASMELPIALSPHTRMRIGSATKHYTALLYMLLCEEGRAGLDDPVGKHLSGLHPIAQGVMMRQLMGHTSGLRDAFDLRHNFSGTRNLVSSADVLSLYRDIDDINFEAGAAWCYNNGAYFMLSAVIERITGRSLAENLRSRIFEPLSMWDTTLRSYDSDFLPHSATLHTTGASGGFEKNYMGAELGGAGGIVSTVDDQLRWLAHMDAPRVGSAATWSVMKTAQALVNGTSTGYGLGFIHAPYRGVETLSHAGGVMGGNSQILKVPAMGLDIVVMVNRHDVLGQLLVNQILDACLAGLDPPAESSPDAPITGVFRSSATGRVIYMFARGGQQFAWILGWTLQLMVDAAGMLRPISRLSFLQWGVTPRGDSASPHSITFSCFGAIDELTSVSDERAADVSAIAGTYRSRGTGTEVTIAASASGPQLITNGRFGSAVYRLEPLADGIWWAKSPPPMAWGGILSFEDDGSAFRMSTFCNWDIAFRRDA